MRVRVLPRGSSAPKFGTECLIHRAESCTYNAEWHIQSRIFNAFFDLQRRTSTCNAEFHIQRQSKIRHGVCCHTTPNHAVPNAETIQRRIFNAKFPRLFFCVCCVLDVLCVLVLCVMCVYCMYMEIPEIPPDSVGNSLL